MNWNQWLPGRKGSNLKTDGKSRKWSGTLESSKKHGIPPLCSCRLGVYSTWGIRCGALDMSGNVFEHCSPTWLNHFYEEIINTYMIKIHRVCPFLLCQKHLLTFYVEHFLTILLPSQDKKDFEHACTFLSLLSHFKWSLKKPLCYVNLLLCTVDT